MFNNSSKKDLSTLLPEGSLRNLNLITSPRWSKAPLPAGEGPSSLKIPANTLICPLPLTGDDCTRSRLFLPWTSVCPGLVRCFPLLIW